MRGFVSLCRTTSHARMAADRRVTPAINRCRATRTNRLIAVATLLFVGLGLSGCRQQPTPDTNAVHSVLERGPLKLMVEASPAKLQVGDTVRIHVQVDAPEDVEVVLPTAQAFGDLDVVATDTPEPRPGAAGRVWQATFALTPLLSGTIEIPSLTARYARPAAAPAVQPPPPAPGTNAASQPASQPTYSELVSEPLKLEVASALTDNDHPEQPRDITGTLLPPRPPLPWWVKALLAAAAVAFIGLCVATFFVIRRLLHRPPPILVPEVWALDELEKLHRADLLMTGQVQTYYYKLTEIIRRYIELKFGLAATEMTTEEFLRALARNQRALPYDAAKLQAFLEACDLVKYAAQQPAREDAEAVLATARNFVHATAAAAAQHAAQRAAEAQRHAETDAAGAPQMVVVARKVAHESDASGDHAPRRPGEEHDTALPFHLLTTKPPHPGGADAPAPPPPANRPDPPPPPGGAP